MSLYATISMFVLYHKNLKIIITDKFEIVTDVLIGKREENSMRLYQPATPNILTFSKFGKFILPECTSYSFSEQFHMHNAELLRSSNIDDEFYLIIDTKNNILQIYNTRFFNI